LTEWVLVLGADDEVDKFLKNKSFVLPKDP
jgi:hypothetical protein